MARAAVPSPLALVPSRSCHMALHLRFIAGSWWWGGQDHQTVLPFAGKPYSPTESFSLISSFVILRRWMSCRASLSLSRPLLRSKSALLTTWPASETVGHLVHFASKSLRQLFHYTCTAVASLAFTYLQAHDLSCSRGHSYSHHLPGFTFLHLAVGQFSRLGANYTWCDTTVLVFSYLGGLHTQGLREGTGPQKGPLLLSNYFSDGSKWADLLPFSLHSFQTCLKPPL